VLHGILSFVGGSHLLAALIQLNGFIDY